MGGFQKGGFGGCTPVPTFYFLNFLVFLRFGSSALSPSPKGETQTKCSPWLEVCLCIEDQLWLGVVTVSSAGGGVRREWIMHLELSRAGTTVPYVYPQEVRRYRGRYDGTTPVPSGGTTVPPLYPQEVRRCHPCTLRRYDGTTLVPGGGTLVKFLSFFYTEITPGKMTVVPRAGTRVVPSYLVQVQGWYRRTCSRCIIHSAPLNTSVLQFYQTTWGGRQQFNCKFRADATPNRSSFALPNPRGILLLGHAHHMTATQCCQYLLFHEFQWAHSSRPFSLKRYPGRKKNYDFR